MQLIYGNGKLESVNLRYGEVILYPDVHAAPLKTAPEAATPVLVSKNAQ